jgi:NADH-quinone oxidoreductase subunit L
MVFWGKEVAYQHTPHESPMIMLLPMIILGVGSVVAGFIPFGEYITATGVPLESHLSIPVAITSVVVASIGIGIAWRFYKTSSPASDKVAKSFGGFYISAVNKFFVDELYVFITKSIIFRFVSKPLAWFDRNVIDGFMNAVAAITNWIAEQIKELQSGQLQKYAFIFISGVLIILLTVIYANQ